MVAGATAVAITLTWYGGWIALESVSVAGAFAVTAATLWLLRQDCAADYYRSLVPMVVFTVGAYDGTATHIPIEVSSIGSGIAYNVLVNLFPKVGGTSPIMGQSYLPQLAAGEHDVVRIAALPPGAFSGSSRSATSISTVDRTPLGTRSQPRGETPDHRRAQLELPARVSRASFQPKASSLVTRWLYI